MKKITPIVLCGGSGSRLWPTSRDTMPKQFSPLLGNLSTFQETILRTCRPDYGRHLVLTNQAHRFFVRRQLADLSVEADIVVEPVRRDSGPAIAAGCLTVMRDDPEALVLVLASDHLIRNPDAFVDAVMAGVPAATAGRLVTFGVTPTCPDTAYGYIEPGDDVSPGVASVVRFAEKPSAEVAIEYVAAGLLWNSGNFLFRADTLVDEYRRFDPDTVDVLSAAVNSLTADGDAMELGRLYERAATKSVDYAVMEKTDRAAVVPMSCGWSDIGSWDAIWGVCPRDVSGNVVTGDVELLDTRDCLVSTDGPLISVVGMNEVAVIANDDAILVTDRKRSAEIKVLVDQLRRNGRSQADSHSKVHRPWGWYQVTDIGPQFQVKRIVVNPGGRLSLQKHRYRAEHWVVVSGEAKVTVDGDAKLLLPNEHAHIPLGAVHRLENFGQTPVELVEVQTGTYLGEDDIIRLEDVYDRV